MAGVNRQIVLAARPVGFPKESDFRLVESPVPKPGSGQVLVRVSACAVCRTDLHILDGELANPTLPLIPGHEIVGRVVAITDGVTRFKVGDRVGIP